MYTMLDRIQILSVIFIGLLFYMMPTSLQEPNGTVTHTGILLVGEQQEPCQHVHHHESDLRSRERRRWVSLHGLCFSRILWLTPGPDSNIYCTRIIIFTGLLVLFCVVFGLPLFMSCFWWLVQCNTIYFCVR